MTPERERIAERLKAFQRNGYYLIVPIDHGMSGGPIDGLRSLLEINSTLAALTSAQVPSVIVTVGIAWHVQPVEMTNPILQLIGLPAYGLLGARRVQLASVKRARVDGFGGVALQIDPNADGYEKSVALISSLTEEAHENGLPVILMVSDYNWDTPKQLIAAMRSFSELGVDLLKIAAGPHLASIPRGEIAKSSMCPVLFPGGPDSDSFERHLEMAREAGYAGICAGRNVLSRLDTLPSLLVRLDSIFA